MLFQLNNPDLSDPIQGDNRGYHCVRLNCFLPKAAPIKSIQSPRLDEVVCPEGFELVGYLRVCWIPLSEWKKKMRTVYHFQCHFGGNSRISEFLETGDREKLFQTLTLGYRKDASLAEQKEYLKEFEERHSKYYLEFKRWIVDKPYVDYIKVAEEYQRQGIATAMYTYMAKYLGTLGMKLHASKCQTIPAEMAWIRMKEIGLPIKKVNKRICLDFRKKDD